MKERTAIAAQKVEVCLVMLEAEARSIQVNTSSRVEEDNLSTQAKEIKGLEHHMCYN